MLDLLDLLLQLCLCAAHNLVQFLFVVVVLLHHLLLLHSLDLVLNAVQVYQALEAVMRECEDEMAEGFHRFILLQFFVQFFDEELAEFLRTFTYLEDAGQDVFTGGKPFVIGGPLRVDQDVYLRNEEIFCHLADIVVIQADDL